MARTAPENLPRRAVAANGVVTPDADAPGLLGVAADRLDLGSGEPDEVVRRQLDLQPAPPGGDEDRLERERALVEQRRQRPPLPERRDPARDVTGHLLGPVGRRHRRALAERAQV